MQPTNPQSIQITLGDSQSDARPVVRYVGDGEHVEDVEDTNLQVSSFQTTFHQLESQPISVSELDAAGNYHIHHQLKLVQGQEGINTTRR